MKRALNHDRLNRRRAAAGFGLIDGLIALAILAFGLLAMTRLQARALAQATESQSRAVAMQFADELLGYALIDTANRQCYTLPAAGTCASTVARALTTDWDARLAAALPGASATSRCLACTAASNQMDIIISWTGKASGEPRTLTASTDVTP